MPLTIPEAVQLAFEALPIFNETQADVAAMPPPGQRKAIDWAPVIGIEPGSGFYKLLEEVDDPVHNAVDLIPILDLDANGNLAGVLRLIDRTIAEVKD